MVFKFLFKPKAKIEIQSQYKSLPGALLPLQIRLTTQEEIKAQEVRAELIGEETYYVTETYRDSKGHMRTRVVQRNDTIARITKTVAEQPTFIQGAEQQWSLSLQLPSDAPPTCCGKVVNIRWTLKAVLDVPKRPDQSQEMPLHVLCPSPQVSNMSVLPAEKTFDDVILNLKAPQVASAGETLVGQLTLQMKDKLSVQGIRVELVRAEDAGDRKAEEVISKTEISGSTSFNQHEAPSFEFFLDIPAEAPPTARSPHSNLCWKVKAVIDRKMKTDFNVEQEVLVYDASEPTDK